MREESGSAEPLPAVNPQTSGHGNTAIVNASARRHQSSSCRSGLAEPLDGLSGDFGDARSPCRRPTLPA